jgi:hypothetical protein
MATTVGQQAGDGKKRSKGHLFSWLAIIALALFFVGRTIFRTVGARTIETLAGKLIESCPFTDVERSAVLDLVKEFAADVRSGQISANKVRQVTQEVHTARTLAPLAIPLLERVYLDNAPHLPESAKTQMRLDASRFAQGLKTGAIASQVGTELWNRVSDPKPGKEDDPFDRQLKTSLTPQELVQIFDKMRAATNQANVPNQRFMFRPDEELREAIQRGKAPVR